MSEKHGVSRVRSLACQTFSKPMNSNDKQSPLVCPTRARLARQWRAATEHEAESLARTQRNLTCASLDESVTLDAASADDHRATEEAMNELRTHRETHGC